MIDHKMTSRPKVFVTNRCFPETVDILSDVADVDVNMEFEPLPQEDLLARARDATGLMAFMPDRIDAAFLAQCPRLRVIGAALKGFDNIDVAAAQDAGVWVTIVPDLLTAPTAELAIGLMLGLGRQMLAGDQIIRRHGFHGWRPTLYGKGLAGQTVGIVGYGCVGRAIAERLRGFGCTLLAYDRDAPAADRAAADVARMVDLVTLVASSDYVVLALPLLDSTYHLFDAAMLARMKPDALLVNPARGSLVDEAAVADAIEQRRLAGYAADVFECEDWARSDRPSRVEPRLCAPSAPTLLTPHIGSAVEDVRREIERSAARSIVEALSGQAPRLAVNRPRPT